MSRPALRLAIVIAFAVGVSAVASGCVYRMWIQQGNYLDPNSVYQLKEGMTRSQVRYLLGTPMVPYTFDDERWDYLYYMRRGRAAPEERRLSVFFADDKVARFEKVNVPEPLYIPDPSTPAPPVPGAPGATSNPPPAGA
jgi:outer membrane protein assembly factor BamE